MTLLTLNGSAQNTASKKPVSGGTSQHDYSVKIVRFADLEAVMKQNDDKLYVVNFWATWCRPCVLELPEFIEVNDAYRNHPHFKMILVSLDMAKEAEATVRAFLEKRKMDVDVYLLDDNKRMNEWIPAIDKNWSGAIPATVFYRNGEKVEFIENKMQKSELEQLIKKYL
jgi:thiol-disulfide isomerase/thioredoxin